MRAAPIAVLICGLLLISPATFCQSNSTSSTSSDSQTLQELLQEVRQLRQDLRTATAATERAQILLSRLQTEQTAVTEAQKELDEAHETTAQMQEHSQSLENQVKYYTDQDSEERTPNATQRQQIEEMLPRIKTRMDQANQQEQDAQSREMQAKENLQVEQSKMNTLQEELDQVDKILQNLANQPIQ